MGTLRRIVAGGSLALFAALAFGPLVASAAIKPLAAPAVYHLSPTRIKPQIQPNVMIVGQNFTPDTMVAVGGRLATTIDGTDPNHLLVKLPHDLPTGTYQVEVTNRGGMVTAAERLIVEDPDFVLSRKTILLGAGFLALLLLVMRLARTPSLA
jgi:hypothetical protein